MGTGGRDADEAGGQRGKGMGGAVVTSQMSPFNGRGE